MTALETVSLIAGIVGVGAAIWAAKSSAQSARAAARSATSSDRSAKAAEESVQAANRSAGAAEKSAEYAQKSFELEASRNDAAIDVITQWEEEDGGFRLLVKVINRGATIELESVLLFSDPNGEFNSIYLRLLEDLGELRTNKSWRGVTEPIREGEKEWRLFQEPLRVLVSIESEEHPIEVDVEETLEQYIKYKDGIPWNEGQEVPE